MTCGIYMVQNKVNNKIYIGQAVDIEERWKYHKWELRGNRHYNEHLQRAWNKYGESNFGFTIICECDENQLNTLEEYYIFELMTYDDRVGYNKTYGGGGCRATEETKKKMSEALKGENHPLYGKHLSEEHRKKISEALKGENNPFYGKHHSEETRKKLSENHANMKGENHPMYGKHRSEETRKKLSESNNGKTISEETRKKISENNGRYWKGKTRSEETRKKISDSHKGKTISEETRKKLSENNPMKGKFGVKHNRSIPIVQLTLDGELVNVYGSSKEAGRRGFHQGHVNSCCINKGRHKTHGGYKWMYLHEYISNIHPNIKQINLFGKTYEVNQEEVKIE